VSKDLTHISAFQLGKPREAGPEDVRHGHGLVDQAVAVSNILRPSLTRLPELKRADVGEVFAHVSFLLCAGGRWPRGVRTSEWSER